MAVLVDDHAFAEESLKVPGDQDSWQCSQTEHGARTALTVTGRSEGGRGARQIQLAPVDCGGQVRHGSFVSVVDNQTRAGTSNGWVLSNRINRLMDRVGQYQSVRVRRPQELNSQDVGNNQCKDKSGEHDALLVHVSLAEADVAHVAEVDALLFDDRTGKLEAVSHCNIMALLHVNGLVVLLANGNMLGKELLCHLAQWLGDVDHFGLSGKYLFNLVS